MFRFPFWIVDEKIDRHISVVSTDPCWCMCTKCRHSLQFCWCLGAIIGCDLVAVAKEFMMTRFDVSEVPLPSVLIAVQDCKYGAVLSILPLPRATGGNVESETSLPLLQDLFPLYPETDKEEVILEGEDFRIRPPSTSFLTHGYGGPSVVVIFLITICFFTFVWLKIGVWLELCVLYWTSLKFRNLCREETGDLCGDRVRCWEIAIV